jgi:hypothetical protein
MYKNTGNGMKAFGDHNPDAFFIIRVRYFFNNLAKLPQLKLNKLSRASELFIVDFAQK